MRGIYDRDILFFAYDSRDMYKPILRMKRLKLLPL